LDGATGIRFDTSSNVIPGVHQAPGAALVFQCLPGACDSLTRRAESLKCRAVEGWRPRERPGKRNLIMATANQSFPLVWDHGDEDQVRFHANTWRALLWQKRAAA
jgi:hypothetical protein